MKLLRICWTAFTVATFASNLGAQTGDRNVPPRIPGGSLPGTFAPPNQQQPEVEELKRFDIEFPGGTPEELVETIRFKHGPFNILLPTNQDEVQIPEFKMMNVNVAELFNSLSQVSRNTEFKQVGLTDRGQQVKQVVRGMNQWEPQLVSAKEKFFLFRADPPITESSIWHLTIQNQLDPSELRICRFYQLAPYLKNLKIEDVTTAIQTGWKMLQIETPPELNFHKDTQMLIAVGRGSELDIIDAVLEQLAKVPEPEKPANAEPIPQPAKETPAKQ